jgi:hypothetical protein
MLPLLLLLLQVLREARRQNREGMVTLYDDAASLTQASSERYSTVASAEFDRFDEMANLGMATGRVLPLDPEEAQRVASASATSTSPSAIGGKKNKAEALAEYMAGLASEGPGTQRSTAFQPSAPKPAPTQTARKVRILVPTTTTTTTTTTITATARLACLCSLAAGGSWWYVIVVQ